MKIMPARELSNGLIATRPLMFCLAQSAAGWL
jgi:hypothetical protein